MFFFCVFFSIIYISFLHEQIQLAAGFLSVQLMSVSNIMSVLRMSNVYAHKRLIQLVLIINQTK